MTIKPKFPRFSEQIYARGATLIELMIAIAITLFFTVAVYTLYATNEERNRRVAGATDQYQSTALTLGSLTKRLLSTGNGVVQAAPDTANLFYPAMGCALNQIGTRSTVGLIFAPVNAFNGIDGDTPDTLVIMYGSANTPPNPTAVQDAPSASSLTLARTAGFAVGNWVLIANKVTPGAPCFMRQIAAIGTGSLLAGQMADITFTGGAYAALPDPAGNYVVYNMGNLPVLRRYSLPRPNVNSAGVTPGIPPQSLVEEDLMQATDALGINPRVAATHMVNFQVQLGIDTAGTVANYLDATDPPVIADDILDAWVNPPESPARLLPAPQKGGFLAPGSIGFNQVKAIRIGLTSRSPTPERVNAAGSPTNCVSSRGVFAKSEALPADLTTTPPMVSAGGVTTPAPPAGTCWRYDSLSTVVTLRNMVWGLF